MRNKIHIYLALVSLWLLSGMASAQVPDALKTRLEGKTTLPEIMATVNGYLSEMPEGDDRNRLEKRFARWAYQRSMHLGPAGEFVNVSQKTLDALGSLPDAPTITANGSWFFVGPSNATLDNPSADILGNGRVDRIAFHPTDPNIIYVGTPSGGLWRTTNGGTSWTALTSYTPSLGISGIVVSHANPNTLYVLTGDGDADLSNALVALAGYLRLSVGVLVSYDAGETWQQTGQLFNGDYTGYRLVQHPTNANILIAATSEGIYRTTNGGNTWIQERTGKHFDVEFKPGTPTTVYASGLGSFVYSTNTGDTWNTNATFDFALCAGGRVELAVTPDASNRVYLFAAPGSGGSTFCGFYRSTNSGTSFTRLTNSPNILAGESGSGDDQSIYDMGVTVKPSDYLRIITAGLITWKSTDGGSTFNPATSYRESGAYPYIHPDVHDVAYNPLNNYLYAATDGGLYRSTNDGTSWTNLMAGINTAQIYAFDDYDANPNAILFGCQDNGVKYRTTSSNTYSQIYCCDGADGVIDYTNVTKGYNVVNRTIKRFDNFTVSSPTTIANSSFFPELELNSSDPDILYYSYSDVMKYDRSTGSTTTFGTAGVVKGAWALKTCPSNSSRVYAAGGTSYYSSTGELYITSDGGTSWSNISNNTGFPTTYPRISDIGVRPINSPQVFVTFSGYTDGVKVLYSSNSGTSWTNISYDLPNVPIWSIEVDDNNNAYIGCDIGVYYKASGATSWEPFYNNIPNVPVSELAINQTYDQLLASTFGRGMWKTSLRADCPASLTSYVNIEGPYFRSASSSITWYGQVVGGTGTSGVLRAGSYVDLMPGFRADSDPGNKFLAYNGPCDSGLPPVFAPSTMEYGYPADLAQYEKTMTRNEGTLEVRNGAGGGKELVVRLFQQGDVRVILTAMNGAYIRDVTSASNGKGVYTYPVNTGDLAAGTYYFYLVVNNKVVHLQEMEI